MGGMMTYTYLGDGTKVAAVVNLSAPASTPTDNAILEQNCYTPFGTRLQSTDLKTQAANRWRYNYFSMSPYSYCGNDPVNRFDPNGKWDVTVHVYEDRATNGYGYALVTDKDGNEVFRFNVRAEGVKGHDRTKKGGDTPLGTYDIPDNHPWISGGNRLAYGPNSRLNMVPESGEVVEVNRDLIRIHGGRQEEFNEETNNWVPVEEPVLKKTEGCLRAYDADMKSFRLITDNLLKDSRDEHPGKVYIIADLKNESDDKR